MVTLEAGPGWGPAPGEGYIEPSYTGGRRASSRRASGWGRGSSEPTRYMEQLACHVAAACESPEEAGLAVAGYQRLASLTLARKLAAGDNYIAPGERHRMMRDARLPGYLYANPATEAIFTSTADQLGKGNVFKQIGKAINKQASNISKGVNRAMVPVNKIFNAASKAITDVSTSLISVSGNATTGLINDAGNAVQGIGHNVAAFASSPQGTGAILGALTGDPGLGPIGAGAPGAPGFDASGMPLPAGTQYQPQTLLYVGAGVAALVLLVVLTSGGRRR